MPTIINDERKSHCESESEVTVKPLAKTNEQKCNDDIVRRSPVREADQGENDGDNDLERVISRGR